MSDYAAAKPEHPTLTPRFCFSTTALKDFLRASRGTIDDTINQNLNALSTPAQQKFDSSSTSKRSPPPVTRGLGGDACRNFAKNVLLPSWQSRSDVLNYCTSVATSEDPDDPDLLTRTAANQMDRERVVDERLDPYSGRVFPRESRREVLAGVVRNERVVESIVRERSWRIVKERCGEFGVPGENWQSAMDGWRKKENW